MKIDKQLPVITSVDPQERRPAVYRESSTERRQAGQTIPEVSVAARQTGRHSNYSLQLNQQLSAMQSADSYLADLATYLDQLKLQVSQRMSRAQAAEQGSLEETATALEKLLQQRARRTGGSLDANLQLSLNEPARSRFSLPRLDSLDSLRHSGLQTLVIRAGRQSQEPAVVMLDEGMSTEQVLRRFNQALPAPACVQSGQGGPVVVQQQRGRLAEAAGRGATAGRGRNLPRVKFSMWSQSRSACLR